MEGPISFWGYKEQESNLILPEHDDDDDDDDDDFNMPIWACITTPKKDKQIFMKFFIRKFRRILSLVLRLVEIEYYKKTDIHFCLTLSTTIVSIKL